MIKTIAILIATIIIVPYVALNMDQPLNDLQWNMIRTSGWVALLVALYCFVVGEFTKNWSQVDKLWSITPIIYTWLFAVQSNFSPRLVLMAILATLWGVRLTYNFGRRGAYKLKFWEGHEDYRWAVLREKPFLQKQWARTLFNLGFICLYQNALIWLFTLPAVWASAVQPVELGFFDYLLAALFVLFLVLEYIADQQQWDFQNEKHRRLQNQLPLGDNYGKGFVHTGLWAVVRHPNYTAEQSIWLVFYLFSTIGSGNIFNASITGFLLLLLLFQGSADFAEEISGNKYEDYKSYKAMTSKFLPLNGLAIWRSKN